MVYVWSLPSTGVWQKKSILQDVVQAVYSEINVMLWVRPRGLREAALDYVQYGLHKLSYGTALTLVNHLCTRLKMWIEQDGLLLPCLAQAELDLQPHAKVRIANGSSEACGGDDDCRTDDESCSLFLRLVAVVSLPWSFQCWLNGTGPCFPEWGVAVAARLLPRLCHCARARLRWAGGSRLPGAPASARYMRQIV